MRGPTPRATAHTPPLSQKAVLKTIVTGAASALLAAAIIGVGAWMWNSLSDGHLVRLLGGVTLHDLPPPPMLVCEAFARPYHSQWGRTPGDACPEPLNGYAMADWCSGDCSSDDSKVTLCCRYVAQ